jgi:hypothetical protein
MAILSSFCNARGVANGTRTISSVSGAPAGGAATRAEMPCELQDGRRRPMQP